MSFLRILTYNILTGGGDRLPGLAQILNEQQPSAAALIEANNKENAAWLAEAAGMQYIFGQANSASSIAWLSRLPVTGWKNHRRRVFGKTLLQVDVDWEGSSLSLFATHLVYGTAELDEQHRAKEVRAILNIMQPFRRGLCLLAGDFNSLHPGDAPGITAAPLGYLTRRPVEQVLEAGYVDCFHRSHGEQPGWTYPTQDPYLRVDFIFASPALAERLIDCQVVAGEDERHASDHLPLRADFL